MAITLVSPTQGTITMNENLEWIDRATETGVAGSEQETLGARVVIQRLLNVDSNRMITLEAKEDGDKTFGLFTPDCRDKLMTIRDLGEVCELNYHGSGFSVVIPMDGVDLRMYDGYVDTDDDGWWVGQINFITV